MPTLSIKNAPADIVQRLHQRAKQNHRSLQGELMSIIEEAVGPKQETVEPRPYLTPTQLLAYIRTLGVSSGPNGVDIIRIDRDRDEHA